MESSINLTTQEYQEHYQTVLQTLQDTLSTVKQFNQTFEESLSSVSDHPYDIYKNQYLGSDHITIELNNLPVPAKFCPQTCASEISAISHEFTNNFLTQINALSSLSLDADEITSPIESMNAFTVLSATDEGDQIVLDHDRAKNYMSFIDMVKHVPIQMIEQNPQETAMKIISQYIKLMKGN